MIEENAHFQLVNSLHPNIGNKIKVFWGHPEFVSLMQELQSNDGLRPRVGFPLEVMMALHELETLHDGLYPHLVKKSSGIWNV